MTPPVACGSAAVRPQLIGRTRETAALNALLDAVRHGMSGKLLIRGEARIGKTALLEHLTSTRRIVASSAEYAASSTAYPAIIAIIEA